MSESQHSPASSESEPRQPEQKFGPYAGGVGVAIWLNTGKTDDGKRQFRSITISPRRYQDQASGKWKSAKSFQPTDIPTRIFALQQAQEFIIQHPLRNADAGAPNEGDNIPF